MKKEKTKVITKVITKEYILDAIRSIAQANGGIPPGVIMFTQETETKQYDWGKYWIRWSEALKEAGYEPNTYGVPIPEDDLIDKFIALIRELDHFPLRAEMQMKKRRCPDFPSTAVFTRRYGTLPQLATRILEYCQQHDGFEDVIPLCRDRAIARGSTEIRDGKGRAEEMEYVYLLKSGRFYKIGKTNSVGRREYELGVKLPEKAEMMHYIRTDDPTGIEAYWHKRFGEKRKGGEWFGLDPSDVRAFKRRKLM